ncbi:MAG: hypothetical protein JOZ72_00975 [Alphaproteobacteria bacterium]|nr:hypothetical protein [Alphaproteobacteria bacterium]
MQINSASLLVAAQQQQAARSAAPQPAKQFAPLDFKQAAPAQKPLQAAQPGQPGIIQRPGANLDIRV